MAEAQDFISKDRPPKVQIVQTLETWGSEKADELPFVVGVLADLSGTPEQPLPGLDSRKFVEITAGTFDSVLERQKPRVTFRVADKITGKDQELGVDITFTKMEDFEPARVAEKIPWLRPLLEARRQLSQLLSQTDGKADAEEVLAKLITNPELLRAVLATPAEESGSAPESK